MNDHFSLITVSMRPSEQSRPKCGIEDHEVHVWRAQCRLPGRELATLEHTLSQDERARAARFRSRPDRDAFVAGRSILRNILARYLPITPSAIRFDYSAQGKPALARALDGLTLRFNLSHAGDLALYAITRERDVGIDIEQLRPLPDALLIADRFFSPRERALLHTLEGEARETAFFHCWTGKEAYAKATGAGISMPLDRFDVLPVPGDALVLSLNHLDKQPPGPWTLRLLEPADGYVGAVAVQARSCRLRIFDWHGLGPAPSMGLDP